MADLSVGVNSSIGHRQLALAATFVARYLHASQTTDSTEYGTKATAELKDISRMVRRYRHELLAHWHLPDTGSTPLWDAAHLQPAGPGVPRSASRSARSARFLTNAGTKILNRGSGQSSSQFTPPAPGRGRGAGRVSREGRRRRTAGGGSQAACSAAGQPTNQSRTTCPAKICYRCSQPGHIQLFYSQLRKRRR